MQWENKDWVGRMLEPVLNRLALFIPERFSPNQITWCAFVARVTAALLILAGSSVGLAVGAALFVVVGELLDSLDGVHARNQNRCTAYGRFLDMSLDAIAIGILFLSVIYKFGLIHPVFLIALVARLTIAVIFFAKAIAIGVVKLPVIGSWSESIGLALALLAVGFANLFGADLHEYQATPVAVFLIVNLVFNLISAISLLTQTNDFPS